jgi:hypothetical protein
MKEFTGKQVLILVFAIVAGIAFIETSGPVWTWDFLALVFAKALDLRRSI